MPDHPFVNFNFRLELQYGDSGQPICDAEFSAISGLEISMEPKTVREGGNNSRPIHLVGPVSYGQATLKRGMTRDFGLWDWFESVRATDGHGIRADGEIAILTPDGRSDAVRYAITGCLPLKIKLPELTAKDGDIAIEEMQIAYEGLTRQRGAA
jgi:phage tail-like protein